MNDGSALRLLAVANDPARGKSVAEAVAREAGQSVAPVVVESVADALRELRRSAFDAVLALQEPPQLDAVVLAKALRGAGDETPLVVLGHASPIDLEAAVWDAGADEYACLTQTSATQLAGRLRRAVDARRRMRESRRLLVAEQRRLEREAAEANQLVAAQQRLVATLLGDRDAGNDHASTPLRLAGARCSNYAGFAERALLEDTIDAAAVRRLAESLADDQTSGPELLAAHLAVVGRVTDGVAEPAARVIRAQADRLLLEATVHLAEAYRERYVRSIEQAAAPPAAARAA